MRTDRIIKAADDGAVTPNLVDYEVARDTFTWEQARACLDGLPGARGLNLAHECVDRRAAVDADADFHDDLGLDSMDSLNLAIAIHEATGIDIPEVDYPQITSIASCVAYLDAHGGG